MSAIGKYFVTPHAVGQFQDRVKNVSYGEALTYILTTAHTNCKKLPDTQGFVFRVKKPWGYRAIVKPATVAGTLPTIATILKG
jgi:hypothetical protein